MAFFCEHSQYITGYSVHTIRGYKNIVNCFCRISDIEDIEEVNDNLVKQMFYKGRIDRNWGSNTFIVYHKILRVFFRWCIDNGYMEYNPTDDIEVPKLEKRLPVKLTKQQAMRLLEVVYNYPYKYKFLRYRNHAIFATVLYAGIRRGELLGLRLIDFNFERRELTVRSEISKSRINRMIPINRKLMQILRGYLSERKRMGYKTECFFVSNNSDVGLTEHGLKHIIAKVVEESRTKFHVHQFRHTFAINFLNNVGDIAKLKQLLGHKDIRMTSAYVRCIPTSAMRSDVESLDMDNML